MTPLEMALVIVAGLGAGAVNTVVGSGTLLSFPALLAVGLPPVTANVSNAIGLVPGSISGVIGYRRELVGQRRRLVVLGTASAFGGFVGACLLLLLPASVFGAVVPVVILLGTVLVMLGPRVAAYLARRAAATGTTVQELPGWLRGLVLGTGVYGGYFGAAQGVLLMALLGIGVDDSAQRHNALKNVLQALVGTVAAVVFIAVATVDWGAVALIVVGSVIGGQVGASLGRRLPATVLRGLIVVVGIAAAVAFIT